MGSSSNTSTLGIEKEVAFIADRCTCSAQHRSRQNYHLFCF